jgi:hypothetical protein
MYLGCGSDSRALLLVRAILWLQKRVIGLAFLLAFASFVALSLIASFSPHLWQLLSRPLLPVYDLGERIGMVFFPDYAIRGTKGFYLVPLFGAAAQFLLSWAFWFVLVRVFWRTRVNSETNREQKA